MDKSAAPTAYRGEQVAQYDERRFTSPAGRRIHQMERDCLLRALSRVGQEAHILEVGCGTGRLLMEARGMGYRVDGIDASPEMLEVVRGKTGDQYPDLKLEVAEAAKIPVADGTYDLTYSIRVLNQTESPQYALSVIDEMIRITRPGGYILVEFVNRYRPRWGSNKRETTRLGPGEVIQRGRTCGAELVHCYGAFLLGQQAYHAVPALLTGPVYWLDRATAWMTPRLAARVYVLFRKGSGS